MVNRQSLFLSVSIPLTSPDHAFRSSLSPLAREACAIVDKIRDDEQKSTWTSEFEDILAQKTGANVYPGMMFSLAKEKMEKTKLWQIMRKMPKGALLHAHMDAMVDFDYLFDILLKEPGMHIHCAIPLSDAKSLEAAPIKFRFLKSTAGVYMSMDGTLFANSIQQAMFRYGVQTILKTLLCFLPKQRIASQMEAGKDFSHGSKTDAQLPT